MILVPESDENAREAIRCIENGANVNAIGSYERLPIHFAAERGKHFSFLTNGCFLITHGIFFRLL